MGGGRRRRADDAPVGCPSTTAHGHSTSPCGQADLSRASCPTAVVVRYLWRQTHGRRCATVLRAAALRQLRRAAPVSPL